jgi:hypothetical protein
MTSIQGEKLAVRKETFVANARTQLAQERTNILKFREAVLRSEEIVRLHHQILSSMASGLENGIITATDYLAETQYPSTGRDLPFNKPAAAPQGYFGLLYNSGKCGDQSIGLGNSCLGNNQYAIKCIIFTFFKLNAI